MPAFLSAPLHLLAAAVAVASINWFGLIAWRRAAGAHWTERARQLWPARVTAGTNIVLIPVILGFATDAPWWSIVAALVGTILGTYFFDREVQPDLGLRKWLRHVAITWSLQLGIWVPFFAAVALMPATFGARSLAVAGAYLAFHFAVQWGWHLGYLRWFGMLKPAELRLRQIVERTAAHFNVDVRATWQLESALANAFALVTRRELMFTDRLLAICSDEELEAICAHELAHLSESKLVLAGRLLGSLSIFPLIFMVPAVSRFGPAGIALPLVAMVFISTLVNKLRRRMEQHADASAKERQVNEGVYAKALEKMYRENQLPAVNVNDRQTHPHLYDRLLAAGLTPDYPRPERPRKMTLAGWLGVIVFVGLILSSNLAGGVFDWLGSHLEASGFGGADD